jgi:hypothetical protein
VSKSGFKSNVRVAVSPGTSNHENAPGSVAIDRIARSNNAPKRFACVTNVASPRLRIDESPALYTARRLRRLTLWERNAWSFITLSVSHDRAKRPTAALPRSENTRHDEADDRQHGKRDPDRYDEPLATRCRLLDDHYNG